MKQVPHPPTPSPKERGNMKIQIRRRTLSLLKYDDSFRTKRRRVICGIDEAGRGPLAGPVVAAAVIFGDDAYIEGIFDSKQVLPLKREALFEEIMAMAAAVGIGIADHKKIDELNILHATSQAMRIAVSKMKIKPQMIIADGNFFKSGVCKVTNVVKGDEKSFAIGAASIIAKVTRDRIMAEYENSYPRFTFSKHKGYATRAHVEEIEMHGYTAIHRRSFHVKALNYLTPCLRQAGRTYAEGYE